MSQKNEERIFESVAEFENEYFPNYHETTSNSTRGDKSERQGTGLVAEFLKAIRKELASQSR